MASSAKQALWCERAAAFERSGLTRAVWCEREGVARSSLDYWRRRLRVMPPTRGLVPIVVAESSASRSSGTSGSVAIEVAGVRLRAGADVDARWLVTLLRGLR